MSAERRRADSPPTQSNSSRPEPDARGVESPLAREQPQVDDRPPLHHRIEHHRLRARIRALERELEASEHQRQAIIDQYEYLLAAEERERARTDGGRPAEPTTRLGRVLEALDELRR